MQRVRQEGWAVAHAAKATGISRQCAHRWLAGWDAEGDAGLGDRSSSPHRSPNRTPGEVEQRVLEARRTHRHGPDWLGPELGIPPRTVNRILRRRGPPRLSACDPLTGDVIRASKTTAVRYERDRPGELVHVDVKKLGRIPDGAGGGPEFTLTSGNGFVPDPNLSGWMWPVRAVDSLGLASTWTNGTRFSFEPCRLDSGVSCCA